MGPILAIYIYRPFKAKKLTVILEILGKIWLFSNILPLKIDGPQKGRHPRDSLSPPDEAPSIYWAQKVRVWAFWAYPLLPP